MARAVSQPWIDQQAASVVDAAFGQLQVEDPETWAIDGGESDPCYALWAFLLLSYTKDSPFPAGMKALQGSAGFGAYPTGVSPVRHDRLLGLLRGSLGEQRSRCEFCGRSPKRRPGMGDDRPWLR